MNPKVYPNENDRWTVWLFGVYNIEWWLLAKLDVILHSSAARYRLESVCKVLRWKIKGNMDGRNRVYILAKE